MSLKRSFHGAICNMIALDARGALEYAVDQARELEELAYRKQTQGTFLICTLHKAGAFLSMNQAMRDRLGKTEGEVIGTSLYDICPEGVASKRMAKVKEAVGEGRVVHFIDTLTTACFETMIIPMVGSDGKRDRALCMTQIARPCPCHEDTLLEFNHSIELLRPI